MMLWQNGEMREKMEDGRRGWQWEMGDEDEDEDESEMEMGLEMEMKMEMGMQTRCMAWWSGLDGLMT